MYARIVEDTRKEVARFRTIFRTRLAPLYYEKCFLNVFLSRGWRLEEMEDAKIYAFTALAVIAAISYAIVAVPVQAQTQGVQPHLSRYMHYAQPTADGNNNRDGTDSTTAMPCHT
ncbi:MAG TPA: hypothetical protein VHA09_05495, partial [Nitrososphaera sp.]|nr:hypothetical protein [Nitrososphaera sp.]